MSLFMQIEIVRYLLLFGEATLVLFIYHVLLLYTRKLFFILAIINILYIVFNLFVNIVKLEISTRKYAFGYEKIIKKEENNKN